jgi:hypothetical protein
LQRFRNVCFYTWEVARPVGGGCIWVRVGEEIEVLGQSQTLLRKSPGQHCTRLAKAKYIFGGKWILREETCD